MSSFRIKTKEDKTWTQVDTNPTAIAFLLMQLDDLKIGESMKITRINDNELFSNKERN